MDAFTTCLWFDTQGEQAAQFYTSIFPNSSLGKLTPTPPESGPVRR
jgi:predicted 3-demethylubiquinone-9 3-methyltransferase (glyoxalase superfamily)